MAGQRAFPMDGSRAKTDVYPNGGLLIDTSKVDPPDRFSYWADATTELFGPHTFCRRTAQPFDGQMITHQLGPLEVFRVKADPVAVTRTAHPPRSADEEYRLYLHLYGRCLVNVGDRQAELRPGDLVLAEGSEAFSMDCDGTDRWANLELRIPGTLVHPYANRMRKHTGIVMSGQEGVGGLVRRFLVDIAETLDRDQIGSEDARLAQSALDLVLALCLRSEWDQDSPSLQSHDLVLRQIKTYIEQHLGDPDLRPANIARAHFISGRLLYKLFESEGMSVGRWIRMQRFEHCRQDLADPALADETIMQIASRWGFRDAAHFSRFFREISGSSPRAFRAELGATAGSRTW
jgi:AraC-like DNA-binding protein